MKTQVIRYAILGCAVVLASFALSGPAKSVLEITSHAKKGKRYIRGEHFRNSGEPSSLGIPFNGCLCFVLSAAKKSKPRSLK